MTIAMAAFAFLISSMFVATFGLSLREAGREARVYGKIDRRRVF